MSSDEESRPKSVIIERFPLLAAQLSISVSMGSASLSVQPERQGGRVRPEIAWGFRHLQSRRPWR